PPRRAGSSSRTCGGAPRGSATSCGAGRTRTGPPSPRCSAGSPRTSRRSWASRPLVLLVLLALRILRALPRRPDLPLGVGAADPGSALHALARLERLVDLEEVLDLHAVE